MLLSLFKKSPATPEPAIPAGERVYAIGDIHGRDDLFARLLRQIAEDRANAAASRTTLILLGDLIDRGPSSRQVVERAMRVAQEFDAFHLLLGNHEEVFLKAAGGSREAVRFLVKQMGGGPTIASYGLAGPRYDAMTFEELADVMPSLVPPDHRDFLERGEELVVVGDYAFVHAGVRPRTPLAAQQGSDLRWIRGDFLDSRAAHEKVIVHGHTVTPEVEDTGVRIGIDTGAFGTGRLTALVLEGSDRRYLATA